MPDNKQDGKPGEEMDLYCDDLLPYRIDYQPGSHSYLLNSDGERIAQWHDIEDNGKYLIYCVNKFQEAIDAAQAKGETRMFDMAIKLAEEFKGERYSSDTETEFGNYISRLKAKAEGGSG